MDDSEQFDGSTVRRRGYSARRVPSQSGFDGATMLPRSKCQRDDV